MSAPESRPPLTPDDLEQRDLDYGDLPDRPLSPDEIEQRQVAYDGDDDEPV